MAAAPSKDPDAQLLKEKEKLEIKIKEVEAKHKEADAKRKEAETNHAEEKENVAKVKEELKKASEAAASPAPTVDYIVVHSVSKVRPADEDNSKIICKFSLGKDGEVIEGEMLMPNDAARHLKRIGVKK